jgi:hypothetical protein
MSRHDRASPRATDPNTAALKTRIDAFELEGAI